MDFIKNHSFPLHLYECRPLTRVAEVLHNLCMSETFRGKGQNRIAYSSSSIGNEVLAHFTTIQTTQFLRSHSSSPGRSTLHSRSIGVTCHSWVSNIPSTFLSISNSVTRPNSLSLFKNPSMVHRPVCKPATRYIRACSLRRKTPESVWHNGRCRSGFHKVSDARTISNVPSAEVLWPQACPMTFTESCGMLFALMFSSKPFKIASSG